MKKYLICFLLLITLFASGCGAESYPSAIITRDEANTGGNLSFVYDSHSREIYFGGEGEYIQFYSANEASGLKEGYRVGIKVTAPDAVTTTEDAMLEFNDATYNDFLEKVEGQEQNYFYLYPTFSVEARETNFKITWNKNAKPQIYKIILNEKTNFLKGEG